MSEWINIKDQESPINQPVLITDGRVIVVSFFSDRHKDGLGPIWEGYGFGLDGGELDWEWVFKDHEITHWMPLPELPGKEGKTP